MTDKQIIIDGVDVSECIYFKINNKMPMCRACNSGVGSPYCEYHKDCYYKQLKRKEQECEKYKQTLIRTKEIAEKPYSLPCGVVCSYPNCKDDLTENGKYCMELKLKIILQKIKEAIK